MAGCTVPDTWPIIPTTALSTVGAGGIEPISDIGALTIAAGDTVKASAADSFNCKVIDMHNYFKLARGFSIGDTGTGNVGNCTTGTIGSNYQTAAIPTAAVVTADTTSFTFSNINFTITRYEFGDSAYYDALNKALDGGHEFNIYFRNYQTFTGTSTIDKTQSMRISISSQSLNYVMATFQSPNRTTITQPINTLISPP